MSMRIASIGLAGVALIGCVLPALAREDAVKLPAPVVDAALAPAGTPVAKAVLAGGCFWGIEYLFEHVRGVTKAVSGYAGGNASTATYEAVETGATGHAESVEISYDPSKVSYGRLLQVFFSVGHDPTTLNRQGPDEGPQYRSVVFFNDVEQEKIARAYLAQLERAGAFRSPIVTQVVRLPGFYAAEAYHQDYAAQNLSNPYIVINDLPKLENFKALFPEMFVISAR